ncbi:cytosolic carboxypeptidase 6 [Orussus abietinus]|uniref:cytosolic carboxypeptidase 6 n=1 Tax=Orussus abietinus TaxID=222816 RepID=UPI000C71617B|nr:cytosolic carboxypeptidase 6 [Orussus abietinus]
MAEGRDPLEHTSLYRKADSEESDAESGLGNVNRLVIRPPGSSGKAKKGHLCFDASFETGNLGRVDLVSEFEYDLFLRPDTCSPRFRFWFNFTVDNVRAEQRVVFNVVNVSKSRNLFRDGMTPLVKSGSRPRWQRIPRRQVFYYESAQHRDHYVLSFAFAFDREDEVYQFALAYPYSYSRHVGHLDNLCSRWSFVRRDTLALSIQKRKVDLLTVTGVPGSGAEDRPKRVVVVLARVHPGESPSSFVCQGLVDFLVSAHPIARVLRDYVVFKIVPMLNPDGVFLGNSRSTLTGTDLNRSWNRISEWAHPTLAATRTLLEALDRDSASPLDCVLDIHAHANATGAFVYGNAYDDVYRYERHVVLPKILAQLAEDYEAGYTMYNQDPRKAGTARRFLCQLLSERVNCYTVHVSMYGYARKGAPGILPYTEEGYFRLGRNLGRVFLDYYKLLGLIPSGLPDQPTGRRGRQAGQRKRLPRRRPRPRTARTPAPLHFARIHEYFREDAAGAERGPAVSGRIGGARTRVGGPRLDGASRESFHPAAPPEPRLTVIDFNQLTRGGLDLATAIYRCTVAHLTDEECNIRFVATIFVQRTDLRNWQV